MHPNIASHSEKEPEPSLGDSPSDITSKNFTPRTALDEQYEEMKQNLSVKSMRLPGGFEGSATARNNMLSDNEGLSASKRINFNEIYEVNGSNYILDDSSLTPHQRFHHFHHGQPPQSSLKALLDDSRTHLQPGAPLLEAKGYDHYSEEGREAVTVSAIAPGIMSTQSNPTEG